MTQGKAFNHSTPALYDRFMGPLLFEPYARLVAQRADARELPFPGGSFDLVVCQFGVRFFPDKVRANREALRVLDFGSPFRSEIERRDPAALDRAVEAVTEALRPWNGGSTHRRNDDGQTPGVRDEVRKGVSHVCSES